MYYTDSVEQSGEYLRLALDHMGRYKIPLDPMNYTIWYEYVSGKNKHLYSAIEEYIEQPESFTPETNHALFKRYIEDENQALMDEIRTGLRDILLQLIKQVSTTGNEVSLYSQSLENHTNALLDHPGIEDIYQIMKTIIAETKSMEASGDKLKERLAQYNKEINTMRQDMESLRHQADTDPLTGLANRRSFESSLTREMEDSMKGQVKLSLLLMDIDHFKSINDNFGHLTGDKVLRLAAKMIKECVKGKDLVGRQGGDEFIIMLPDTPLDGAMSLARSICSCFNTNEIKRTQSGKTIGSISMSIGAACYRPGESMTEFIQRTDDAMYTSKQRGRNQASKWTPQDPAADASQPPKGNTGSSPLDAGIRSQGNT